MIKKKYFIREYGNGTITGEGLKDLLGAYPLIVGWDLDRATPLCSVLISLIGPNDLSAVWKNM